MKLHIALLAVLFSTTLAAQKRTYVTISTGENIMDKLTSEEVFLYPNFMQGKVYLKDGSIISTRMNYTRVTDEIHFINEKLDTLALGNEKMVKHIIIEKDTMFYDEGYVKQVLGGEKIRLAHKDKWTVIAANKKGAFNSTNNTVQLSAFTLYTASGRIYQLVVNEDIELKRTEQFWVGDENNHFLPANKKNFITLFPKLEPEIVAYLKANKTDFNKREDVEKIVSFLSSKM